MTNDSAWYWRIDSCVHVHWWAEGHRKRTVKHRGKSAIASLTVTTWASSIMDSRFCSTWREFDRSARCRAVVAVRHLTVKNVEAVIFYASQAGRQAKIAVSHTVRSASRERSTTSTWKYNSTSSTLTRSFLANQAILIRCYPVLRSPPTVIF